MNRIIATLKRIKLSCWNGKESTTTFDSSCMGQKRFSNSRWTIYHYTFMWPSWTCKYLRIFLGNNNALFELIQKLLSTNHILPLNIPPIPLTNQNQLTLNDLQLFGQTHNLFLTFLRLNNDLFLPTCPVLITSNELFMLSLVNLFESWTCLSLIQIGC